MRLLDAFHVIRLGFTAVDDVRRRVQQETTGHHARRNDPLHRIRRLLRCGNLSEGRGSGCWLGWMPATSTSRSPGPGSPRRTYAKAYRSRTRAEAAQALNR